VGDHVFVALPGAILPGNFKIKASKIRGIPSEGMMCSASELGLSSSSEGLWILENQPAIGTPINTLYTEYDIIYDLSITANRNDALSYIGIARDLAAYFNLPLKTGLQGIESELGSDLLIKTAQKTLSDLNQTKNSNTQLHLKVTSPHTPYYQLHALTSLKNKPSPDFIKKTLEKIGHKSINAIVDITNYVMLHTGQPLHAFDASKIQGAITVRMAHEGESFEALDHKTYLLKTDDTVIADEQGPLALAGIIGGKRAEVTLTTESLLLESAYFEPDSIRQTARRLNITTDSAYRFERGIDPAMTLPAAHLAKHYFTSITQAIDNQIETTIGKPPFGPHTLHCHPQAIRDILGFGPDDATIQSIFERLHFKVETTATGWTLTLPSSKHEVNNIEGLAEEFLRIYGTDKIPSQAPVITHTHRQPDAKNHFLQKASDYLVGAGFIEAVNYSLCSEKEAHVILSETSCLKVDNPLSIDQAYLRPSLLIGLFNTVCYNLHNGNDARRFFESGHVFKPHNAAVTESLSIAFIMGEIPQKQEWKEPSSPDFYQLKTYIERILKLLDIEMAASDWAPISASDFWQKGHAAEATITREDHTYQVRSGLLNLQYLQAFNIKNNLWASEIIIPLKHFSKNKKPVIYQPFSTFPAIEKDLAFVLPEAQSSHTIIESLTKAIHNQLTANILLENTHIFDVYRGNGLPENHKSIAVRMRFRSLEKTLTDQDIQPIFHTLQQTLKTEGYTLRTE
jgi:phenylalanyl-tRNA synthetase beta chain